MPDVIPADVQTLPSLTNILSASTRTRGKRLCNTAAYLQWVVADRPSSRPAAASRKAPAHTPAPRPAHRVNLLIRATAPASTSPALSGGPPTPHPDTTGLPLQHLVVSMCK